jgi:dTDP-4-dehydrorhamnose reductase
VEHARSCSVRPAWLKAKIGDKPVIVRQVLPIQTKDYPTPARRPVYSLLSNALLEQKLGVKLPDWRIQLKTALAFQASG